MAKKSWAAAAILFMALSLLWAFAPAGGAELSACGNPFTQVKIGRTVVKAEVVSSPEKHYLGLSHRAELPEGQGMLFLMGSLELRYFCMRGMHFPIDIIWIAQGQVQGIAKDLSPLDQSRTYCSPAPANAVLEVPGGFSDRQGIKVGDKASW
jgi:uncharacterized protein